MVSTFCLILSTFFSSLGFIMYLLCTHFAHFCSSVHILSTFPCIVFNFCPLSTHFLSIFCPSFVHLLSRWTKGEQKVDKNADKKFTLVFSLLVSNFCPHFFHFVTTFVNFALFLHIVCLLSLKFFLLLLNFCPLFAPKMLPSLS